MESATSAAGKSAWRIALGDPALRRRAGAAALLTFIAFAGLQCVQDLIVSPPNVTYVFSLSPDSAVVNVGDTVAPFTLTFTADGRAVSFTPGFTVVAGANVVRVDSLGRLIVTGRGVARIRVRPLSVALPVDTLADTVTTWAVVPRLGVSTARTEDTLTSLQETFTIEATAQTRSGVAIPNVPIAWRQVSGGAVAVLEDTAAGRVRALANGVAEFEAFVDGVTARRPVRVRQVPASLAVTDSVRLRSFGQTAQLAATTRDARGNGIVDAAPVWTALDPTVATVNTTGQVRSVANGVARIEARVGAVADTARVTVAQTAYQLAFTVHPTAVTAGATLAPAIVVGVRDSLGTVVAAATNSVTVALSGGGTMNGTTTRGAMAGVATFDDLRVLTAGSGVSLVATATGLVGATSNPFAIGTAAPAQLAFGTQPGAVRVGAAIGPPVAVRVIDSFGNLVTTVAVSVTITLGTNPSSGTLSGTATQAGAAGIATFPDLTIDRAGAGYTLLASATGLTGAASAPFSVELPPARLAFRTQPTTTVAGVAVAPAVQVEAQDSLGTPVTLMTATVDLALGAGAPAGASLTGTVSAAAVGGVAAFGNLRLRTTGSGYALVATSAGLAGVTSGTFNVVPGPANRLGFLRQPSTAEVNTVLVPPVEVGAIDSIGNVATGAAASVSLALATYPTGATLAGTTTVSTVGGIAAFSDLRLSLAGTGYTLRATATGLTSAVSTGIAVSACTDPYEPNDSIPVAAALTPGTPVSGKLCAYADADYFKFTVAAGQRITVALSPPSAYYYYATLYSPSLASLTSVYAAGSPAEGTYTATTAGTYYVKVYAATSSVSTTLPYTLTVTLLTVQPVRVKITTQPSSITAGSSFAPSVQVAVQDASGSTVTTSTASITLGVATGPTGTALTGTLTHAAVNGVATFTGVSATLAGSTRIVASSPGLTADTSAAFAVSPSPAGRLVFSTQPSAVVRNATFSPAVQVVVQDTMGNTVTTSSLTITMALSSNPGSATLGGSSVVSASSGIATFATLTLSAAGSGYTLRATGGTLTGVTSAAFDVAANGPPVKLGFTVQPPATAGYAVVLGPAVQVAVQDVVGNTVTSATESIALSLTANPSLATLSGTTTRPTVNGVATFSDLNLNRSGSGFVLGAAVTGGSGLTSVSSSAFSVQTTGTVMNGATAINGMTLNGSTIYYTESGTFSGTVKRVESIGGTVTTLASVLSQPGAVVSDATNVYWIETADGSTGQARIGRVPINGGTVATVVSGLTITNGGYWLFLDGGNLFFLAGNSIKTIAASATDGVATDFVTGSTPYFTVSGSTVYYADAGPSIKKVPTAGGASTTLTTDFDGIANSTGLTVAAGRVYFYAWRNGSQCILSVATSGGAIASHSCYVASEFFASDGASFYGQASGYMLYRYPIDFSGSTMLASDMRASPLLLDDANLYYQNNGFDIIKRPK